MSPNKSSFWPTRPPQHRWSCWSLGMSLARVCFKTCPKFLKLSGYMRNRGFSNCVKKPETLQRNLAYPQIQLHGLSESCVTSAHGVFLPSQGPGFPEGSPGRGGSLSADWEGSLAGCPSTTQLCPYAASSWYDAPHSWEIIIEFPRIWT